jgi:mannose-6-phosphate isomerase-like protein (cupin superfamily)
MSDEDEIKLTAGNQFFLRNPYREFLVKEGVPVYEEYAVDCLTLPLEPWARAGGLGAYVNLAGRGDWTACFVQEVPAGGQTNVEQHVFDKVYYVFKGRGSTRIELPSGASHSFEWGPGSMFGIPLNAKHQLFNGSGSEPARLAGCSNLPLYLNLTHNEKFIFENPWVFEDRLGEERYFRGEGEFRAVRPGRHQWETNFVSDITSFELPEWQARGAGGRNIMYTLADSPMHIHLSEFPVGTYKKGHFHDAGAHIFLVAGQGYSLLWQRGQDPLDTVRVDWKVGSLFAPPDGPTYHQHFNTAQTPSRYLVMGGINGARWAVLDSRAREMVISRTDRSQNEGGRQVEYQDEDPRILELYEQECARAGVQPKMREMIAAAKEKAAAAVA